MSSQGKFVKEKKDPLRPFYPIIGLVILAIGGAVGWFSAPFILDFGEAYIPPEVTRSLIEVHPLAPEMTVTGLVVLLLVLVFSAIFAIFAPKPEKLVTEGALKREREQIQQDRRRTKARKRKMRERMRQGTKGMDEI